MRIGKGWVAYLQVGEHLHVAGCVRGRLGASDVEPAGLHVASCTAAVLCRRVLARRRVVTAILGGAF